jgi:hypothetical protein
MTFKGRWRAELDSRPVPLSLLISVLSPPVSSLQSPRAAVMCCFVSLLIFGAENISIGSLSRDVNEIIAILEEQLCPADS